jgi:hypothetical protein
MEPKEIAALENMLRDLGGLYLECTTDGAADEETKRTFADTLVDGMLTEDLRLGNPGDPWTAPQTKGAAMATLLGFLLDYFAECEDVFEGELKEQHALFKSAFPWPGPCNRDMVDAIDAALAKRGKWGAPLLD